MKVGRKHPVRLPGSHLCLEWPAVLDVLVYAALLVGVLLIGAGLFLLLGGDLPGWWERRFVWPLVHLTPGVVRLQGIAGITIGASILAIIFARKMPDPIAGLVVLLALLAYVAGAAVFVFSAVLSRREVD
jgi:uncharacterized membrane protein AbrB (regulator of aidB expression)